MTCIRAAACAALCVLALAHATRAAAQPSASNGIVFIRIIGDVRAVVTDETGASRQVDMQNVEVATGSGFVISQYGHILTNHHVIAGGKIQGRIRGQRATLEVTVRQVDILVPTAMGGETFSAAVLASDPDLDLAVLTIPGAELSYIPFGDSDAVQVGQSVSVVGYPLGDQLDLGRGSSELPPAPTTTSGTISALREDLQGGLRFLQTTAPVNRGNSGGPMLDRGGYAVGVIQMKVRDAEAIGFAIPINAVKDFLARYGIDTSLPSSRLSLGPGIELPDKFLKFQPVYGFQDSGIGRLLVDSGASLPNVTLRIDRIASPWTLEQIEAALRGAGTFERFPSSAHAESERDERILRGQSAGRADGRPFRMMYALFDLGDEKVVARYVGGAEQVAFNESVLAASLRTMQIARMLAPPAPLAPRWAAVRDASATLFKYVPGGWVLDAGAPMPCRDLPAAVQSAATSPRLDFTIAFRAALIDARIDPASAAQQCARTTTGSEGGYRYTFSRFGVSYVVEGVFRAVDGRLAQFEMVSPNDQAAAVRELFAQWLQQGI